ncbi:sensor histidine kinase [Geodermatophilus sp. SYSU D00758]
MTLVANPLSPPDRPHLIADLGALLRRGLRRRPRRAAPTPEDAVVRALCHDMRSPLASLESLLAALGRPGLPPAEVLDLARAQAAHLSSMLRTAAATGGAPPRHTDRRLGDVVRAAVTGCGLPAEQLTLEVRGCAGDVWVADARVQRILSNLLENAHRHGDGAPVRLLVRCRPGWVDLALTQAVDRPERVVGHLRTDVPPADLTGLGLWSVRRQARELGGRVVWDDDGTALTLTVQLPDR